MYFISNDTTRWIDVINEIVDNINNTYNRGIKAKPIDVLNDIFLENKIIQFKKIITDNIQSNSDNYNVGDLVRVMNYKNTFTNKMNPKYSNEIYKIKTVNTNKLIVTDTNNKEHTFKKSKVLKISSETENNKSNNNINESIKENRFNRLIQKENLGNNILETRTPELEKIQRKIILIIRKTY